MTSRGVGLLPAGALLFIVAGLAFRFAVGPGPASLVWGVGLAVTGAPVVWTTLRGVAAGRLAADLVAMLAIVGALLLGEPLAGLIVVLMQTGGEALERYAEGRASEAVRELQAAAPRIAHRIGDGGPEDVPVEAVEVGDELLVRPGEVIPCDAEVAEGTSSIDTSRLTGEPIPVAARPGIKIPQRQSEPGPPAQDPGDLSGLGMAAASLGWLPPVPGALVQEAIDVAVILNALRASFPPPSHG